MAKKQTRRSLSLNRAFYERLKAYCDSQGLAIAPTVERFMTMMLDEQGAPVPTDDQIEIETKQHFTW